MQNVAIRLPEDLILRLARHAERLAKQTPGVAFTRSDAVRVLLLQALDLAEKTTPRGR